LSHHLCDLHSFPTRRSSDLFNFMTNQELDKQHLAGRTDLLNQFVNPKTAHQVASRLHEILRKVLYEGLHAAFFVAILLAVISMVDRKSTRLNSSHVSISYAV